MVKILFYLASVLFGGGILIVIGLISALQRVFQSGRTKVPAETSRLVGLGALAIALLAFIYFPLAFVYQDWKEEQARVPTQERRAAAKERAASIETSFK